MENRQLRKIKEAKEAIKGLEKFALLDIMLYIDDRIKIYEIRHKV